MAANTDKLRKGFYGSATTISANISNTDTTIPLSSTVGLPTDTGIDIVIDRVDANGNKTPSKQETLTVVISGTNGTNALRGVEGLAQAHSSGAVVEILYTAATHNDHVNWGLAQHKQDGSHGAVTADSLSVAGTPSTDFASHFANFLSDGGIWAQSSGVIGTATAGHVYYGGQRHSIPAVASNTFAVSNDTYVDVNPTSSAWTYVPVANGAAEPAVTASCVRVAKVVTSASAITSIDQNSYNKPVVSDTLAESAVTSSKLSLSKSSDANGWTVIDYGTFKMYTKKIAVNTSVASGARSAGTDSLLPVGVSNLTDLTCTYSYIGVFSGHATAGIEANGTGHIVTYIGNEYTGGTLAFSGNINIIAIK